MSKWSIEYSEETIKKLKHFDNYVSKMIVTWIDKNLNDTQNPRSKGKALASNLKGYWRYRIGDYRLICELHDDRLVILCVTVGHRKEVYK